MGKIINVDFGSENRAYANGTKSSEVHVSKKPPIKFPVVEGGNYKDRFEKEERKEKPLSYSIPDMVELLGEEKVNDIFSFYFRGKNSAAFGILSPLEKEMPLKEGLKKVWDNSEESKKEKMDKAIQLTKMSHAIRAFEKACSKEHEERYGEKADIRIKIKSKDDDEEVFLADEIRKQADFYKKGKLGATFSLIGNKISEGFERIIDYTLYPEEDE